MIKKSFCLIVFIGFICGYLSFAWGADQGEIFSGETRLSTIAGPSFMDTWTFQGEAGDRIIITAVTTSGPLNTEIYLYPPDSGPCEADTYPFGDKLDHQLQQSGLYTAIVQDHGLNDEGEYNITFLKIPGAVSYPGDLDGGAIASGETSSGSSIASDMDAFQFYGEAGDRIIITAVTTSGPLNTEIYLYPPDSGPCEADTYPFGDKLDHQLQQSGLYTAIVQDHGLNDEGEYNITFLKIPGAVSYPGDLDGGAIASGETSSGSSIASDMDAFQFYGEAGDRIIITAVTTSGPLNTEIYLYPPDSGPCEADTYPVGDKLDHQLQQSGLYTAIVQDHGLNDEGEYNISLTKIPSALRPGIYNPSPQNGATISDLNDSFSWDAVSGATGYDLYFGEGVIEPLGKIGDNLSSPSMAFPTLKRGKVYYWHVVAKTSGGDIQGPYWWFRTYKNVVAPWLQLLLLGD